MGYLTSIIFLFIVSMAAFTLCIKKDKTPRQKQKNTSTTNTSLNTGEPTSLDTSQLFMHLKDKYDSFKDSKGRHLFEGRKNIVKRDEALGIIFLANQDCASISLD